MPTTAKGVVHQNTCTVGAATTVENCIIFDNGNSSFVDQISGHKCVEDSCIENMTVGTTGVCTGGAGGNINNPPVFEDAPNGDYRLDATSPCIDRGDSGSGCAHPLPADGFDIDQDADQSERTPDLLLLTRIVGVSSACDVDMGAYEFGSFTCAGDANGNGVVDVNDLLLVVGMWGPCPTPPAACAGDISPVECKDGQVDVNDLLLVIGTWGCGSGDEVPEYVDDCWDTCDEWFDHGYDSWDDCYYDCVETASGG